MELLARITQQMSDVGKSLGMSEPKGLPFVDDGPVFALLAEDMVTSRMCVLRSLRPPVRHTLFSWRRRVGHIVDGVRNGLRERVKQGKILVVESPSAAGVHRFDHAECSVRRDQRRAHEAACFPLRLFVDSSEKQTDQPIHRRRAATGPCAGPSRQCPGMQESECVQAAQRSVGLLQRSMESRARRFPDPAAGSRHPRP